MPDPFATVDDGIDAGTLRVVATGDAGRQDAKIEPDWLQDLRRAGSAAAERAEFPSQSDEGWRYTPAELFGFEGRLLAPDSGAPDLDLVRTVAGRLGPRDGLVVTWAGGFDVIEEPGAWTAVPFAAAAGPPRCLSSGDDDLFVAINARYASTPLLLTADPSTRSEAPLVVIHWACGHATEPGVESGAVKSGAVLLPRIAADIPVGADVGLVECFAGSAPGGLVVPVSDIGVAASARLRYASVQLLADDTDFVGAANIEIGRDSQVECGFALLGGRAARYCPSVVLAEPGAEAGAVGVYVGDTGRHVDVRSVQHHQSGHTRSDLLIRGAVWGGSRSVFAGLVRIDADAARCEARQASHYLVLSDDAAAVNIPNLEILNHDVACGHSSSGGPPDPDQIYYLQSRGIDPAAAQKLVVDGFFADVVARLPEPGLRGLVGNAVQQRLDLRIPEGTVQGASRGMEE